MGRKGRFLVIGCGSIGKRHIGNLIALNERDILAFDVMPDRRREVQSLFGVSVLDNLVDAWKAGPDVVVVTAPTSLHLSAAIEAAQRRCHLFIEKPLSHNREGLEDLQDLVRKKGLLTLVGCNMRFHPGVQRIKKMLEDGAIGRTMAIRAEFGQYLPDWHPGEDYRQGYSARSELGGGIILDAIHEIDYIRWLAGEVDTVACLCGKIGSLEIDTEDTAAILLRFTNGAIGEIHMDYLQRAYTRTCRIIGEEGTIRWDHAAKTVACYSAGNRAWQSLRDPTDWEPNRMYLDEFRHFLACLAGNEKPCQDVFEATRVLKIALAARESAREQQFIRVGS
jgi:predicted dehydrogenase